MTSVKAIVTVRTLLGDGVREDPPRHVGRQARRVRDVREDDRQRDSRPADARRKTHEVGRQRLDEAILGDATAETARYIHILCANNNIYSQNVM